jgi:hypothetical protein
MIRSPSFSRCSSSATTTMPPAARWASATRCVEGALTMARPSAATWPASSRSTYFASTSTSMFTWSPGCGVFQRRDRGGVRDDGHRERVGGGRHDGEADAVDRDRALLHHVAHEVRRGCAPAGRALVAAPRRRRRRGPAPGGRRGGRPAAPNAPGSAATRRDSVQAGAGERLLADIGHPPAGALLDQGEAAAVDRDRVAQHVRPPTRPRRECAAAGRSNASTCPSLPRFL